MWYSCCENLLEPVFSKGCSSCIVMVNLWTQNRWYFFFELFVSKSGSTFLHAFIFDITVDLYFKLSLVKILNSLDDWLAGWSKVYHENCHDLTLQCSISLPCHSNLNETHILIAIYSVPECHPVSLTTSLTITNWIASFCWGTVFMLCYNLI